MGYIGLGSSEYKGVLVGHLQSDPDNMVLFDLFVPLLSERMATLGFQRAAGVGKLRFDRLVGECLHRFEFYISYETVKLRIQPMVIVRSIPLWEKANVADLDRGHLFGMLSHFLPARKRKTRGGFLSHMPVWYIASEKVISLAVDEMVAATELVIPFMDQFTTTGDVLSGMEKGIFSPFPEKALEWHRLIWEGKLDSAQTSMSDYCGRFLSWDKSSRDRWELARGADVGVVRREQAEELKKLFGGKDPYGWDEQDLW